MQVLHVHHMQECTLQEDVQSIEAGAIPMPKYANSQAAFYAVQQAPPPMPMPPPIPIETSATVSRLDSFTHLRLENAQTQQAESGSHICLNWVTCQVTRFQTDMATAFRLISLRMLRTQVSEGAHCCHQLF